MSEQAERWHHVSLPSTAGHGDLGPSNCLISSSGQVGVTDWEGGVGTRSPLVDILIFLHHYARAVPTRRRQPARGAFSRAFLADGWLAELTAANVHRQLRRLGAPPAAAPLLVASTLADLASGEAQTAHSLRPGARRHWSACLEAFAEGHEKSLLGGRHVTGI
jgi:aminoglycoside phosphotransferase (APT) family kinase protein